MKKSISTQATKANINAILTILKDTPKKLADFASRVSAQNAHTALGAGERSFIEDVAHLINCEALASQAICLALMLKEPLLHNIHAERDWGKVLAYDSFKLADLLAYFKFRRLVLLRILESLTDEQWLRVVREENKQRKESVYWQARGLALHELDHLQDLEKKLAQG